MSAPERIWAKPEHPDENGYGGFWIKARVEPSVEYRRADLCDPMQDYRVRELVEAAKAVDRYCHWFQEGDELRAALRALEGADT